MNILRLSLLLAIFTIFSTAHAATPTGTTVGDTAKPEALFAEISAAAKPNQIVTVRPGTYVIPAVAATDNSSAWKFSGANALKDCTVDLTGVTLIFQGSNGSNLEFGGCQNSVFRGATVYKTNSVFHTGKNRQYHHD